MPTPLCEARQPKSGFSLSMAGILFRKPRSPVMSPVDEYISYIQSVRRYSPRTVAIYRDSLNLFLSYLGESEGIDLSQADTVALEERLLPTIVRSYELWLLDTREMASVTVSQHLSVLSGFCRFRMKEGRMKSNPVKSGGSHQGTARRCRAG